MTRDEVLRLLRETDGYASGEKIRQKLGVSRMAVSAAVKSLRADGYEILSSTNRGYLLTKAPDLLTAPEIRARLGDERMRSVVCLDTTDSTNRQLRLLADEGAPEGTVVLADAQTQGRGRRGRSFLSPKGTGIYLSYLLRPEVLPSDMTTVTAWTAVAVREAVRGVCGVSPGIKWVNDLVLNRKKICGILTEMALESESAHIDHIIIGIGINVGQKEADFPEELREVATSIRAAFVSDPSGGQPAPPPRSFSRASLAAAVIQRLDRLRADWPDRTEDYLAAYREASVTCGQSVTVISGEKKRPAEALSINDDFSLRVRYEDGTCEDLSSGEVSVRGLYGYV